MKNAQRYVYEFRVNNGPRQASHRDQVAGMLAAGCGEGFAGAEKSIRELHERGTISRTLSMDTMRFIFIARAI